MISMILSPASSKAGGGERFGHSAIVIGDHPMNELLSRFIRVVGTAGQILFWCVAICAALAPGVILFAKGYRLGALQLGIPVGLWMGYEGCAKHVVADEVADIDAGQQWQAKVYATIGAAVLALSLFLPAGVVDSQFGSGELPVSSGVYVAWFAGMVMALGIQHAQWKHPICVKGFWSGGSPWIPIS